MIDSLDLIDRRILREIQSDGRLAVVDLAERVGLTKSPCLKRLRRLERDGIIRGYRADLDPDRIQQAYLAYVQIKLSSTTRATLEAFNARVKTVPEIMSCHMMAGGFDYLLKVRTRDMKAYRQFMGDVLSQLPNVAQTSTFPVMEQVKESHELVISQARD
ncbi:MAG: Lrp/AsnC ligand binding domain-containing protein [Pseudomonadota bacterium]